MNRKFIENCDFNQEFEKPFTLIIRSHKHAFEIKVKRVDAHMSNFDVIGRTFSEKKVLADNEKMNKDGFVFCGLYLENSKKNNYFLNFYKYDIDKENPSRILLKISKKDVLFVKS